MKKEKSVRTYQRKSKSGKIVTVHSYKAKYDAAEEARKEMAKRAGAGDELKKRKSAAPADLGFTADEFKIWANDLDVEEAKRIDKILVKKYGEKAVQKLADEINAGNSRTHKAVFARLSSEKLKESKKDRVVDDFLSGKDVSKQLTEKKPSRKTTKVGKGEYQTGMKVANKKLSAKEQKLVDKILDENKGELDKEYLEAFYPEVSKKVHEAVMKAQSAKSPKEESVKKVATKATKSSQSPEVLDEIKRLEKVTSKKNAPDTVKYKLRALKQGKDLNTAQALADQQDYIRWQTKNGNIKRATGGNKAYFDEQLQILKDLQAKGAKSLSQKDIQRKQDAFIRKHKLTYEEDGMYSDKSGKTYRLTTHPISGETKMHPLYGTTYGAKDAQFKAAGFKKKNGRFDYEDDAAWDRLSKIIWGKDANKK